MSKEMSLIEQWEWITQLDTIYKVSVFSFLIGIFLGIYLTTGVNIKPDDLLYDTLNKIVTSLEEPFSTSIWNFLIIPVLLITGIFEAYISIKSIANFEIAGIIASITGFLSGLTLILYSSTSWGQWSFVILALVSFIGAPILKELI